MTGISLQAINDRLDTLVLVEAADGQFQILGDSVGWLSLFSENIASDTPLSVEETLLFFDSYIDEVREVLERDEKAIVNSGPWSERDLEGQERNLSAVAFITEGKICLQLRLVGESQLYHRAVFQKAREYSLGYERLVSEREKKEVLLHAIVHDLAGPLTAITGVISLLATRETVDEKLLQVALQQCEIEKDMITKILQVYAAELTPAPLAVTFDDAPDLLSCVTDLYSAFNPAFEHQLVKLAIEQPSLPEIRIAAEEDLLVRVLSNLLQNALRFSPVHSVTTIQVTVNDDRVRVCVVDEGPGVPEEQRATIFDLFAGDRAQGGSIGLGLYFCRITVERWGGRIGCEANEPVGTRVWFELPLLGRD